MNLCQNKLWSIQALTLLHLINYKLITYTDKKINSAPSKSCHLTSLRAILSSIWWRTQNNLFKTWELLILIQLNVTIYRFLIWSTFITFENMKIHCIRGRCEHTNIHKQILTAPVIANWHKQANKKLTF